MAEMSNELRRQPLAIGKDLQIGLDHQRLGEFRCGGRRAEAEHGPAHWRYANDGSSLLIFRILNESEVIGDAQQEALRPGLKVQWLGLLAPEGVMLAHP